MAQNPILRQVSVTTSQTAMFTVATDAREYITKVIACNTTGANRQLSIWITSGSTPSTNNALIISRTLRGAQPMATEDIRELSGLVLNTGWKLWAQANGTGIVLTIQTIEVT